jgi:hypothetical protein
MSLHELLERAKAASGPDRELDAEIEHAARFQRGLSLGLKPDQIAVWNHVGNGYVESHGTRYASPAYTASIDAAVALISRVLPGLYMWQLEFDDEPTDCPYMARLYTTNGAPSGVSESGPTAPLALIVALLEAKIAEDKL